MSIIKDAKAMFIETHAASLTEVAAPSPSRAGQLEFPHPLHLCPVREVGMNELQYHQALGAKQGYMDLAQRAATLPQARRAVHLNRLQHALEDYGYVFETTPKRTIALNHVRGALPAAGTVAAQLWRSTRANSRS